MPDGIEDWKIEVLKLLGEKVITAETSNNTSSSPLNKNRVRDPNTVLPQVTMPGNPPPTGKVGKFLASQLFGSSSSRHDQNNPTTIENKRKILDLEMKGELAPVRITANGRNLKGNFYSANGHNLKSEDYKPDLERPVVLLLTGSGGSSENQGFDVASMYSQNGASVLSVNYGGYGDSDDTPVSEQSLNQDAQAMLEYLVGMGYDPEKIVLHGYSMGASVAGQLGGAYESQGVKFRGMVQDRPMTSAYDGVIGHMGKAAHGIGKLTESKLGAMSGKDGMLQTSKDTRKVVTSDEGGFAKSGDKLRDKLESEGHTVGGKRTGKDHFDHGEMIKQNRDELLDLVRFDRDGAPAPQPLDMEVVFNETLREILDEAGTIFGLINQGRDQQSTDLLDQAMQSIASVQTKIEQLESTGLGESNRFKPDMNRLTLWKKKLETYRASVMEESKKLTGQNPYAVGELIRLTATISRLNMQFEQAGGANQDNKALEDEVLKLSGDCGALLKEVKELPKLKKEQPGLFLEFDELLKARKAILSSRTERERALKQAGLDLGNFAKRPDLLKQAQAELTREMDADFKKLEAQDEDVSAKRLIGKSKDAGFKKAVVQPVAAILPKIRQLMEKGQEINAQTLPELPGVQQVLQEALQLYQGKLNQTDQRKHPKDYAQRQKKVEAVQSRIQGLNGLLDKANNAASKIKGKIDQKKPESLKQLEDSGVVKNLQTLVGTITQDKNQDTGDQNGDKAVRDRAEVNIKLAAKVLENADMFQRDAIFRNKFEPKALAQIIARSNSIADDAVETLLDEFGDDEAYLEQLADAAILNDFEESGGGTKPMRSNTIASKFITRVSATPEMTKMMGDVVDDLKSEIKGKKFAARCPDPIAENDSNDVKQQKQRELLDWERTVTEHISVFRKIFGKILSQPVPPAVAKICETLHSAAMQKFNDEETALSYVGGHVFLRLFNPAMTTAKYDTPDAKRVAVVQSKVLQSMANGGHVKDRGFDRLNDMIDELAPQVKEYLKWAVEVGAAAKADMTVQDLAESALMSGSEVGKLFVEPTADDPLGTLPANPLSMLGDAIAKLRTQRNTDYDWQDMSELKENSPVVFWEQVDDERRIVLDLVAKM